MAARDNKANTMSMWRAQILVASLAATARAQDFHKSGNGTCIFKDELHGFTLGFVQQNYKGVGNEFCHDHCSRDNRCAAFTLDIQRKICKKHGNYSTFNINKTDNEGFEFGQAMSDQTLSTEYIAAHVKGDTDDTHGCMCWSKKPPPPHPPKASAHRHVAGAAAVLALGLSLPLAL